MIVLDKPWETGFDALIKEHCDAQKQLGVPATVYLLIGSRMGDDLYVAHVAKCPLPDTALDQVRTSRSSNYPLKFVPIVWAFLLGEIELSTRYVLFCRWRCLGHVLYGG